MSNLAHDSKLKDHDDNDDIRLHQGLANGTRQAGSEIRFCQYLPFTAQMCLIQYHCNDQKGICHAHREVAYVFIKAWSVKPESWDSHWD